MKKIDVWKRKIAKEERKRTERERNLLDTLRPIHEQLRQSLKRAGYYGPY